MLKSWSNIVTFGCIVIAGFIEAAQQAMKDAPNFTALFPRWMSGSFWNYLPLLLLCVGGAAWIVGRFLPSKPNQVQPNGDWREAFRKPHFELITGHTFVNKSIGIDGKSFRDCVFENVSFVFRGNAPTEFLGTTRVTGGFSFDTDNPAIMVYSKLQRMARSFPGVQIKEGPVDEKGNLLAENFGIKPLLPAHEPKQDQRSGLPIDGGPHEQLERAQEAVFVDDILAMSIADLKVDLAHDYEFRQKYHAIPTGKYRKLEELKELLAAEPNRCR